MKINELQVGMVNELHAVVAQLGVVRFPWKCFSCGMKSEGTMDISLKLDKCPKCGALPSAVFRKGLWNQEVVDHTISDETGQALLTLWNKEITNLNLQVGDKIKILDRYCVRNLRNEYYISKSIGKDANGNPRDPGQIIKSLNNG